MNRSTYEKHNGLAVLSKERFMEEIAFGEKDFSYCYIKDMGNVNEMSFENYCFDGSCIMGMNAHGCNFSNTSFIKANIEGMFKKCNMENCDLSHSDLQLHINDSILRNCNFSDAHWKNGNIINSEIDNLDVSGAVFEDTWATNCNVVNPCKGESYMYSGWKF